MERITAKYTLTGVQHLIQQILDREGMSTFQLAKASSLHFTTLYSILNKTEDEPRRPIRRSTILAIGKAVGYDVQFDSRRKEIILSREELPKAKNDVDELLHELRNVLINSGRRKFEESEKKKIVEVFRALVGSAHR